MSARLRRRTARACLQIAGNEIARFWFLETISRPDLCFLIGPTMQRHNRLGSRSDTLDFVMATRGPS